MLEFWIKQIIMVTVYIGTLMFSILNFSTETSRVLAPILTTVFVWVMNNTFSKDYQTKNEKELKDYQGKIDKEMEDYKNEWNQKLEDYKNKLDAELETHKAKLSGYTLVTKLQYDLEFKIYTEIYEKLAKFFIATKELNAAMDTEKVTELKKIDSIYKKQLECIFTKIDIHKPFYSEEIYSKIDEMIILTTKISEEFENYIEIYEEKETEKSFEAYSSQSPTKDIKKYKIGYKKEMCYETIADYEVKDKELVKLIRERIVNMKIVE